jgi:hypothetical protein
VTEDVSSSERALALDARTRAMTSLRNVCEPKENRDRVFTYEGLPECLMKVIREDPGEARVLACGALALLAKTPSCREGMARTKGLIDILAEVLSGEVPRPVVEPEEEKKDDDDGEGSLSSEGSSVHDEDDDHSGSSFSSEGSTCVDPPSAQASVNFASIRKRNEGMHDEFLQRARSNACAALLHLSKHCPVTVRLHRQIEFYMKRNVHVYSPIYPCLPLSQTKLCSSARLMRALVAVSKETDNPLHLKCLEIIFNLTRFPANNGLLTRFDGVVGTLVLAAKFTTPEARISALRAFQNMSADSSSKALLADNVVLSLLTAGSMRSDAAEKEAALCTLFNIITEPTAVTSVTNTKNLVATLVHLAHNPESSSNVSLVACEALATISYWLQSLASKGRVPEGIINTPLPSQKTSSWERWN